MNVKIKSVLDSVIEKIENSLVDDKWEAPWKNLFGNYPKNAITGKLYRNSNVIFLTLSQLANGYSHALWGTYKQWASKKATVRKGEKGTPILFYTRIITEDDNGDKKAFPMLRIFYVFNVDQVDDYEVEIPEEIDDNEISLHAKSEEVIKNTGAKIKFGGDMACYVPSEDFIKMPDPKQFKSDIGYYNVMFHELGHWTGHDSRLNRKFGSTFGDSDYAFEELIAELSSAFTCAMLGLEIETRDDHAKYVKRWLRGLKKDPKCILKAATQAQKATDYILGNNDNDE